MDHPTAAALDAGLDDVRRSPADDGPVELIVRRPRRGSGTEPASAEREILAEGVLDPAVGLVGDTWASRSSRRTPGGSPHPGMQLTLMNARAAALVAGDRARGAAWASLPAQT